MRLLYAPTETRRTPETLTRRDIVFAYADVSTIWEGALNKLIDSDGNKIDIAFNHFFAEYFTPPEFTEDEFIAILGTLEAFQRRTRERDYFMPREQYRKTLLKRFNEPLDTALHNGDISQDFHASLKKLLNSGYQFSLSERFDDLFTTYGNEFLTIFIREKKSDFIREIIATYNWLTHSDPEYRNDALKSGAELALMNQRLELFAVGLLLDYIGIPQEKIRDVYNLHRFEYLRLSKADPRHLDSG